MSYRFTDPSAFPYQSGAIFLGLDPSTGQEIGIETERHAITIGGAGSGKGACLLIPNARRWPHNLLCIDVKGENAAAAWEAREAMGQHIGVLDPYAIADIPPRLRVSINPLTSIHSESLTVAEDLRFVADGMIVRSNPKNAEWDNGARDLLAGLLAYVVAEAPPEQRTLTTMRRLLMQPKETLYDDAQRMVACTACGGLAAAAGVTIMTALESDSGRPSKFLEGARTATLWLDSEPMKKALGSSTFDLSELKSGEASLFLVLPPKYLGAAAGFFRLFVQSAIGAMQSSARVERRCLFMLDEFHTLGKMDEIAKAAGLMRGYGLHLWPFLQDLGQLHDLYTPTASETFFGNADVAAFLGNSDILTLEYISRRLGKLTPQEIGTPPSQDVAPYDIAHARPIRSGNTTNDGWEAAANENDRRRVDQQNETRRRAVDAENARRRAEYEHAMRRVGSPRLTPDEIAPLIGKGKGDEVARRMIVFGPAGAVLNLKPAPYFAPDAPVDLGPPQAAARLANWYWLYPSNLPAKLAGGAIVFVLAATIISQFAPNAFAFWLAVGIITALAPAALALRLGGLSWIYAAFFAFGLLAAFGQADQASEYPIIIRAIGNGLLMAGIAYMFKTLWGWWKTT